MPATKTPRRAAKVKPACLRPATDPEHMPHEPASTLMGGSQIVKCLYCGTAGQYVPYNRRPKGADTGGRYVWGSAMLRLMPRETPAPTVQPDLFGEMAPVLAAEVGKRRPARKRQRTA